MPHELHVGHVAQLRIVLEGTFNGLPLGWAHANISSLPILNQLTVMSVLELDDLVDVLRRRRGTVL